ncbi:MAG: hypothetical protein ACJ8EY_10455 [Sphingomicrobium sp.]
METIIFSLVEERVWASWPATNGLLELGPSDAVIYMMRDFIAQCDLGEHLSSADCTDKKRRQPHHH